MSIRNFGKKLLNTALYIKDKTGNGDWVEGVIPSYDNYGNPYNRKVVYNRNNSNITSKGKIIPNLDGDWIPDDVQITDYGRTRIYNNGNRWLSFDKLSNGKIYMTYDNGKETLINMQEIPKEELYKYDRFLKFKEGNKILKRNNTMTYDYDEFMNLFAGVEEFKCGGKPKKAACGCKAKKVKKAQNGTKTKKTPKYEGNNEDSPEVFNMVVASKPEADEVERRAQERDALVRENPEILLNELNSGLLNPMVTELRRRMGLPPYKPTRIPLNRQLNIKVR